MLDQGDIQAVDEEHKLTARYLIISRYFKACLMTGNINTLQNIYDEYIFSI